MKERVENYIKQCFEKDYLITIPAKEVKEKVQELHSNMSKDTLESLNGFAGGIKGLMEFLLSVYRTHEKFMVYKDVDHEGGEVILDDFIHPVEHVEVTYFDEEKCEANVIIKFGVHDPKYKFDAELFNLEKNCVLIANEEHCFFCMKVELNEQRLMSFEDNEPQMDGNAAIDNALQQEGVDEEAVAFNVTKFHAIPPVIGAVVAKVEDEKEVTERFRQTMLYICKNMEHEHEQMQQKMTMKNSAGKSQNIEW